jgi:hypothetical protein
MKFEHHANIVLVCDVTVKLSLALHIASLTATRSAAARRLQACSARAPGARRDGSPVVPAPAGRGWDAIEERARNAYTGQHELKRDADGSGCCCDGCYCCDGGSAVGRRRWLRVVDRSAAMAAVMATAMEASTAASTATAVAGATAAAAAAW